MYSHLIQLSKMNPMTEHSPDLYQHIKEYFSNKEWRMLDELVYQDMKLYRTDDQQLHQNLLDKLKPMT